MAVFLLLLLVLISIYLVSIIIGRLFILILLVMGKDIMRVWFLPETDLTDLISVSA